MRPLILRLFTLMLLSLTGVCNATGAQDGMTNAPPPQNDLSSLRASLRTLQLQEQQILSSLNEIKQLLAANAAGRPVPQLPTPPSALATQDEPFRGDNGATVAIVEYADFECPFCGQYEHDVFPQLSKDYIQTGEVKYFFRDL